MGYHQAMLRLLVIRLLQLPVILAVVFAITLTLAWQIPGNPLERTEGRRPSPAVQAAMLRQYNLHSPWAFAGSYLKGIFVGVDGHGPLYFGPSLQYQDQTVSGILREALPVSMTLGIAALAVAMVLGTAAGVIGALRPGTALDFASLALVLGGISLPSFVTGSVLLLVLAGWLGLFPIGEWGTPLHMVLPAITLGLMPAAYIARLIRLGLADVMTSDYIRTARAKGLSKRACLFRHGLKIAMLPVVSFMGPASASVLTGSFVVEKVFNIPGMGAYFVNAVLNDDQFMILAVALVYATLLVLLNLVVDLAYAWIDPRIEMS